MALLLVAGVPAVGSAVLIPLLDTVARPACAVLVAVSGVMMLREYPHATVFAGISTVLLCFLPICNDVNSAFLFMAAVYLPIVAVFGKTSPARFIKGTLASYTMGFTTTSSVATLPVLLRDAPALGVSPRIANLVLPLAASMNRAGSGLFQGASVVFLAWFMSPCSLP